MAGPAALSKFIGKAADGQSVSVLLVPAELHWDYKSDGKGVFSTVKQTTNK